MEERRVRNASALIDCGEIAEDGGRVHVAGAEFFFDEGEIGANEGEV